MYMYKYKRKEHMNIYTFARYTPTTKFQLNKTNQSHHIKCWLGAKMNKLEKNVILEHIHQLLVRKEFCMQRTKRQRCRQPIYSSDLNGNGENNLHEWLDAVKSRVIAASPFYFLFSPSHLAARSERLERGHSYIRSLKTWRAVWKG